MSWYNDGDWDDLDGGDIPYALADLCNAINERREALLMGRVAWRVNTGTELLPVVGTKSSALVPDDFFGLDLFDYDYFGVVYTELTDLLGPNTTIWGKWYSGYAIDPNGTGLALDDELWTISKVLVETGLQSPLLATGIFDRDAAVFMREVLDRMLYPVVYPIQNVSAKNIPVTANFESTVGSSYPHLPISAQDAWDSLAASTLPATSSLAFDDIVAEIEARIPTIYLPPPQYAASATIEVEHEISFATNGVFQGIIKKAYLSIAVYSNTMDAPIQIDVFGEVFDPVNGIMEHEVPVGFFSLSSKKTGSIKIKTWTIDDNPFNGVLSHTYIPGTLSWSGIGGFTARLWTKLNDWSPSYDNKGYVRENPEFNTTRIILDQSTIFTDQAS